jgi:tRNA nucleotidyltransferase (CCA-adding enzyme)
MINGSTDIEKKILKKIAPSLQQRTELEACIQDLKKAVQREITKRKLSISIELVGSTAKDTFLIDALDIDLFLLFPIKTPREELEKNGLIIGRAVLKNTEEGYAEHPYVKGFYQQYKTEIVPCYKIESAEQLLSAVDRTPLHTKYVKKHLLDSQKNDVRLFKQFLQGIGCYGAEAEIEGFSGYLCELLIIKYESFCNLIYNAQKWTIGERLTLSDEDFPFFDTPLTVIDPVDNNRNVASALSKEKFEIFIKACKEYVKKPCITFFFPNKVQSWSLEKIQREIEKLGSLFIGIEIEKPDIISENLHPQIRKAVCSIQDVCERNDFTILDTAFHIDDERNTIFITIKTTKEPLSEMLTHAGPPIKLKKNVHDFLQKWKNNPRAVTKPYEKDGRIYVEMERKYRDIKHLLKDQVKNLSIGKNLDVCVKKGYKIIGLDKLLNKGTKVFWTVYLDKKMPWER